MPLAIVLAAAWVKILTPAQIAAELRQGPEFLEADLRDLPDRQRSIKSVVAQSWHRLTAAERAAFMRLTVFRGGFTLTAAQLVAGASLPTISALVTKSLVRRGPDDRYTIYHLLRHYAEIELEAAGQTAAACSAHCAYYTDLLEQCAADTARGCAPLATQRISADLANVQAARQWALAHCDAAAAARFLAALSVLCATSCCSQEGMELLCT
jgi:predicted ATPase